MSIENLQYPIGKFKKPENISSDILHSAISKIESLPDRLKETAASLSSEKLQSPYRPGGWTIWQLVHHIVDSHMNAYVRFKITMTEERPTIRPYEEAEWANLIDTELTDTAVSIGLLSSLHQRWVTLMKNLSDKQLNKCYYHPGDDEWVELKTAILMYEWHGEHHLAHITNAIN